MPDHIAASIEERSARGIAAGVSRLISAGDLPPGTRLPTVRDLARRLGTSPTTVSEAWQKLAHGLCGERKKALDGLLSRDVPENLFEELCAVAVGLKPDAFSRRELERGGGS